MGLSEHSDAAVHAILTFAETQSAVNGTGKGASKKAKEFKGHHKVRYRSAPITHPAAGFLSRSHWGRADRFPPDARIRPRSSLRGVRFPPKGRKRTQHTALID